MRHKEEPIPAPTNPKIYHITHIDNLPSILNDGYLISDAEMIKRGGPNSNIGMTDIKQRRLKLPVKVLENVLVGECVPFNFCPRSVMLYIIHMANHPNLQYRGGQEPIVHLEADLNKVVAWADHHRVPWAFSLSNAAAHYTHFRDSLSQLGDVNWAAVHATQFRQGDVREDKQAEFLLYRAFPWHLIDRIGVRSSAIKVRVQRDLNAALNANPMVHQPSVTILPNWYY